MVKNLLVICSQKENYFQLFAGRTIGGEDIVVDQAPWVDVELVSYPDSLVVHIKPNRNPFPYTTQGQFRTFAPHFVLLRSYALGNHEHDWRNKIAAMYHFDIPCINSIDSFVWSVEKVSLYTKLRRVQKKDPSFPLVPQTYYSHPSGGSFQPDFPSVLKIGSSSQGVGKAKVHNSDQWQDMLSVLSMSKEYFTTEPFMDWVSDVRVQKIGTHYRAIERKRMSEQASWKANNANGITENDVEVKEQWKKWIDAAAAELDMAMCGMDLIVDKDGKEFILEINSSSIGFPARHAKEDTEHVRDLVLDKMAAQFGGALGTKPVPEPTMPSSPKSADEEKKEKKEKKKKFGLF